MQLLKNPKKVGSSQSRLKDRGPAVLKIKVRRRRLIEAEFKGSRPVKKIWIERSNKATRFLLDKINKNWPIENRREVRVSDESHF